MKKHIFCLFAFIIFAASRGICQSPPEEFFNGLDHFKSDPKQAKKEFLKAVSIDPKFHGSYHFLGVIYLDENNPDSAIWCFKTSIALNIDNTNHTKEMTYVRLISTYVYKHDFSKAFNSAWEAYQLYDDNRSITSQLKDICLWSFYIKYDNLDPAYLAPVVKKEYNVNSISEEYLIFRWLKSGNEYLEMNSQSLRAMHDANYDVFSCTLSESKQATELYFKINWDMNKYFGGKQPLTQPVIDNSKNPIYERVGAMLVADDKTDIKAAITKLQGQ